MREVAWAGDVQASAFDLAHEVLEESLSQPGVGVEEEDQLSLCAEASYIPATRDGRLAVENLVGACLAMRTVASQEPASTTMTSLGLRLWRCMSESS
jgi:hypothetical protein